MLLDFDQGSMIVCKDDGKLGVMVAEGLSGPLCWAISMGGRGPQRPHQVRARTRVADGGGAGSGVAREQVQAEAAV
jgi:hypothetical protein